MAGGEVVVGPCPCAPPLTVLALLGAKTPSIRGDPQCTFGDLFVSKCCERHEPVRPSYRRDHEAVQVVDNGPGEHLAQRARIAGVSGPQSAEIFTPVALVDDRRGIPKANEDQVEQQSPGAPVPVDEWMDSFELIVRQGQRFDRAPSPAVAVRVG